MDEWHLGERSVKQNIIDLAIEHNLVSKFTSFVAVEHKIVNLNPLTAKVPIPVELPDGWNYDAIFGTYYNLAQKDPEDEEDGVKLIPISLPKTATNMPRYIVLGLSLILISIMMFITQSYRRRVRKN